MKTVEKSRDRCLFGYPQRARTSWLLKSSLEWKFSEQAKAVKLINYIQLNISHPSRWLHRNPMELLFDTVKSWIKILIVINNFLKIEKVPENI